jgi:hypothetical protein
MWMIAAAAALAGCGLQGGSASSGVTLTVTRGFGARTVAARSYRSIPGATTVLGITQRSFPVRLTGRRPPVQAIADATASSRDAWFLYINGSAVALGPAASSLHSGDQIWWDLHPAAAATHSIVGSFPEPFVHGIGGKRLPTTLECASDVGQACRQVTAALEAIGVPVAVQAPGTGSGTDSLAVAVGTWADLRGEIVAELLQKGPSASGVFARFTRSGRSLELLNAQGAAVQRVTTGGGLVAAIGQGSTPPTWLVTGTDPAGVTSAAGALTPNRLHDRFALAISAGADTPLPVTSR